MSKVFISHSPQDRPLVDQEIVGLLNAYGIDTVSDDSASTVDLQNLESCDWFLVAMTSHSAWSKKVKDEVRWAMTNRKKRTIPALFGGCAPLDFHSEMVQIQAIDFTHDQEGARKQLLRTWGITKVIQFCCDQALSFCEEGAYSRAITCHAEAVNLDAFDTDAYVNRKGIAEELATAYVGRGVDFREKGYCTKAIADFFEAIRLNPANPMAYHNRGLAYRQNNDHDLAIADFSEAVRLSPCPDASAYIARALTFAEQNNHDRAIPDYMEALRLNPDDVDVHYRLARALHQRERYDDAILHYTEVIRLEPNHAKAYNERGLAFQRNEDSAHAIADFSEAIRLGCAEARDNRRRALIKEGAVVANPRSHRYYLPSEKSYQRALRQKNVTWFTDELAAQTAGYHHE